MKNGTPSGHTDRARQLATELEELDWDEDSSVTIVDGATGRKVRVKAPSHAEIEVSQVSEEPPPTVPEAAKVPSSAPAPAKGAAHVLRHVDTWKHVAALAIIAAFLAFAIWRGLQLW
jgi:hypothetical protein